MHQKLSVLSVPFLTLLLFGSLHLRVELAHSQKLGEPTQAVEIGLVQWSRNYEASLLKSQRIKKPLFLLFQEVPGCSGCKQFGAEVLSHPLLVEAIESEFVPIVVFNNRGGKDSELLKKFGEPSWNYQVVRFLNADESDIIPRKDKIWSLARLAARMNIALKTYGNPVPLYLEQLSIDLNDSKIERVLFAQHCFWTGERILGSHPAVLQTQAGFYQGREVTKVWFDSEKSSLEELTQYATQANVADKVYKVSALKHESYRPAPQSDQKRQLQGTALASLSDDPILQTKLNAFVRSDYSKALEYLSPRQRRTLGQ